MPDVIGAVAVGTVIAAASLWVRGGGVQAVVAGGPGRLATLGRLTGLIAADLLLVQVALMARIPWVERTFGQDQLARWHRVVGSASVGLMLAHVALTTGGYVAAGRTPVTVEAWRLAAGYPGVLLAVAGTAALVMVAVTSVRVVRRHLRYESWHLLHLYAYLGIGLSLPHELWTGADFTGPLAQAYWWTLYVAVAGAVVVFRLGLPLYRSVRHNLRIHAVVPESPTVTSVYLSGRRLDRLPVRAGQFFNWRFLGRRGWSRAQPYSLSAAPRPDLLRITVREVGDGSRAARGLRPGMRALVEGPYGRLTAAARSRSRLTMIASGIGITPMRALLEAEPYRPGEATLIYRAGDVEDLTFRAELDRLSATRGVRLVYLVGRRGARGSWLPAPVGAGAADDIRALRDIAPDIAASDVFVCGPEPWMDAVVRTLRRAGVAPEQIHRERFSW